MTADPGGNFASDAHRRVMAHLPNPDDPAMELSTTCMAERIGPDQHTGADADEVKEILKDLEALGYAKQLKSGWKNTKEGFDVLTGPPDESAVAGSGDLGLDPGTPTSN